MKHSYTHSKRVVRGLIGPFTHKEAASAAEVSIDLIEDWVAGRTRPRKPAFRRLIDHHYAWCKHFEQDPEPLRSEALRMLMDIDDLTDDQNTVQKEA